MLNIYNIILFIFYLFNVIFLFQINGHWGQYIDSEIIWPYNSLLILSDYKVEFIEFGSVYYILLAIFLKILNFINLSEIHNLEILLSSKNYSNTMQELFFYTRLFTSILGFIFLIILKKIFFKITKDEIISFILIILFFYSPGFIVSMSHSRADFVSVLFVIFCIYFLICFVEDKNENLNNLFLFFFFFNFAILTKLQVFFYFPWICLSVIFFCKKSNFSSKKFIYNNKIFYFIVIFLILIALIYPLIYLRHTKLSILFLYYQLCSFNLLFFYYIKFYKIGISKNNFFSLVMRYNFILLIVYFFCFNFFSNLFFLNDTLIIKLTYLDPSSILQFIDNTSLHKQNFTFNFDIILSILNTFIYNIFKIIDFYFLSLNFQSILLYLILFLFLFSFKKQLINIRICTPIILIIFFMINFINLMRVNEVKPLYFIFSDFLLFIILAINLNFIKYKKTLQIFVYSTIIVAFFTFNIANIKTTYYGYHTFLKKDKLKYWCNQQYVENFAKKLTTTFYEHCKLNY
jgi:hypothetical protein